MEIDTERIDEAVLALLLLGLHDGSRVWKSFDWDAMERLHKKGLISDPVGKAKSVVLTEEGQREAERLFTQMFAARRCQLVDPNAAVCRRDAPLSLHKTFLEKALECWIQRAFFDLKQIIRGSLYLLD